MASVLRLVDLAEPGGQPRGILSPAQLAPWHASGTFVRLLRRNLPFHPTQFETIKIANQISNTKGGATGSPLFQFPKGAAPCLPHRTPSSARPAPPRAPPDTSSPTTLPARPHSNPPG